MTLKLKCSCLSKSLKKKIIESNMDSSAKDMLLDVSTCGYMADNEVVELINALRSYRGIGTVALSDVIVSMKSRGLSKHEIDEQLLKMKNDNMIELEVGTPIGATLDELADKTITTPRARYAYVKNIK